MIGPFKNKLEAFQDTKTTNIAFLLSKLNDDKVTV